MRRAVLTAVALLTFAGVAQAQTTVVQGENKVVFKKKTVINFGDFDCVGTLEKPEAALLIVRPQPKFASLIRLRANFKPELAESVNHL